jgi:hypothetical protein
MFYSQTDQAHPDRAGWAGAIAGTFLLLGFLAALVLLAKGLYPTALPASANPDFVDNVFDNRAVVWAARLLLVSADVVLAVGGVFVVASTLIRMKNGEWLRRAGPFEVSEVSVDGMVGQVDYWREVALARQCEVEEAEQALDETDEEIRRLLDLQGGSG